MSLVSLLHLFPNLLCPFLPPPPKETILQKKFHLYDLYIKKHTIHLPNKEAQVPLNITEGDTLRFAYLDQIMGSPSKAHVEDQLLKYALPSCLNSRD